MTTAKDVTAEEAEIICGELNAHADEMRKAVLALAYHVRGAEAAELADAVAGVGRS